LVSKFKEKKEKLDLELDGLKEVLKGKDDKLDKIIKKINEEMEQHRISHPIAEDNK
jgi:chaperonin cofactor prefoldin